MLFYSGTDRSLIEVEMGSMLLPGNEGSSQNRDNKLENKQNYFRSLTKNLFSTSPFFRHALVGLYVSSSLDSHIFAVTREHQAHRTQPYIFGRKHLCFGLCALDGPLQDEVNANKLAVGKAIELFLSRVSVTISRSYACNSKGIPLSRVFLFMICIIFGCRAILV